MALAADVDVMPVCKREVMFSRNIHMYSTLKKMSFRTLVFIFHFTICIRNKKH